MVEEEKNKNGKKNFIKKNHFISPLPTKFIVSRNLFGHFFLQKFYPANNLAAVQLVVQLRSSVAQLLSRVVQLPSRVVYLPFRVYKLLSRVVCVVFVSVQTGHK